MGKLLVTGSTGQLGRPTTAALRAAGVDVLGLTRSGGAGAVAIDLRTGRGLDEAVQGVDTIVHLASTNGRRDVEMARNLTDSARRARVAHLVLISIVGIDETPLRFYRDRVEIEQIALASGVPLTIQRATQFHSLIDRIFSVQKLPMIFVPQWRVQPIAVEDVARRLAELAVGPPQGRVDDISGPAQHSMRDLHTFWRRATGSRRPAVMVHFPGRLFAAYDAGVNLVPGPGYGTKTFESYLQEKYR
jgi:uncharacterized protein YbjT (DUF2867 family)